MLTLLCWQTKDGRFAKQVTADQAYAAERLVHLADLRRRGRVVEFYLGGTETGGEDPQQVIEAMVERRRQDGRRQTTRR